jgi:hypothetical protein
MRKLASRGLVTYIAGDNQIVENKIIDTIARAVAAGENHRARIGIGCCIDVLNGGGVSGWTPIGKDDITAAQVGDISVSK